MPLPPISASRAPRRRATTISGRRDKPVTVASCSSRSRAAPMSVALGSGWSMAASRPQAPEPTPCRLRRGAAGETPPTLTLLRSARRCALQPIGAHFEIVGDLREIAGELRLILFHLLARQLADRGRTFAEQFGGFVPGHRIALRLPQQAC